MPRKVAPVGGSAIPRSRHSRPPPASPRAPGQLDDTRHLTGTPGPARNPPDYQTRDSSSVHRRPKRRIWLAPPAGERSHPPPDNTSPADASPGDHPESETQSEQTPQSPPGLRGRLDGWAGQPFTPASGSSRGGAPYPAPPSSAARLQSSRLGNRPCRPWRRSGSTGGPGRTVVRHGQRP
jgi:hypothetical protein